jgi:phage-related minor tail protein
MGKGASTTAGTGELKREARTLADAGSEGAIPAPMGRAGGGSWRAESEAVTSNETSMSVPRAGPSNLSQP